MESKCITTVKWLFRDSVDAYPELKGKDMKISTPDILYKNFRFLFEKETKEKFTVFWLNSRKRVIGFEIVCEGVLDASIAAPREIFRGAIVSTCAGIILAHNHPSGSTEPSNEDITATKTLKEAGKILGISVLDHIIFTDEGYFSFVENNLM